MRAAVKPAVEGAGTMKTDSTVERASTAEPASANESASAAKPTAAVKASTTTMKSAATAVKASTATVAATLRESRFNAAKHQKHGDCKENCRKGFFHFSSSDQVTCASRATRDCL
jgi:hypothetical protein